MVLFSAVRRGSCTWTTTHTYLSSCYGACADCSSHQLSRPLLLSSNTVISPFQHTELLTKSNLQIVILHSASVFCVIVVVSLVVASKDWIVEFFVLLSLMTIGCIVIWWSELLSPHYHMLRHDKLSIILIILPECWKYWYWVLEWPEGSLLPVTTLSRSLVTSQHG